MIGEEARGVNGPVVSSGYESDLLGNVTVSAPALTINTLPVRPILTISDGTLQTLDFNMAAEQGQTGLTVQDGGAFLVRDFRTSEVDAGFSAGKSEYRLEGGYLSTVIAVIGDDGDSTFRQSGGTFDAGTFILGAASVSSSSGIIVTGRADYIMTGGTLDTGFLGFPDGSTDSNLDRNGTATVIGDGGPARFTLNGGTHTVRGGSSFFADPLVVGGAAFHPNGNNIPDDPDKHLGEYIINDGTLNVVYNTVVGETMKISSRRTTAWIPVTAA